MKDIPGIDENGNPKNGPFKVYFKNGLVSCEGEFNNGKKSGKWTYFLNNGQMQSTGSYKDNKIAGEPFLVPIAIPMIAGPSVLAMLILMTQSSPNSTVNWLFAVIIAWALTAVILLAAPFLYRILKERGLIAMERLMGMILVMMAVQMIINGIKVLL